MKNGDWTATARRRRSLKTPSTRPSSSTSKFRLELAPLRREGSYRRRRPKGVGSQSDIARPIIGRAICVFRNLMPYTFRSAVESDVQATTDIYNVPVMAGK